jgi:hypothetical protein
MRYILSTFPVFVSLFVVASAQEAPQKFSIPALVKEMSPGVVHVAVVNSAGKPTAYGSGFVIEPAGTIVTAYHVIRGATAAMVKTSDGEIYDRVDVAQYDLRRDVAILRIQPYRQLKALRLANEDEVVVGEDAAAIGNPQGLEATVSAGIVSGYRQAEGYRLVQTTVPVSPGSSGGPLFNMADFTRRVAASSHAALGDRVTASATAGSWRVLHAHGQSFRDACTGTITIANGRFLFIPETPGHGIDVPGTSIAEVERNSTVGYSMQAFHVRLTNGTNHNFSHVDEGGRPQHPGAIIYAGMVAKRGQ